MPSPSVKLQRSNSGFVDSIFDDEVDREDWVNIIFDVKEFMHAVPGLQEEQAHRLMVRSIEDFRFHHETPMGLSEAMVAIGDIQKQMEALIAFERMEAQEIKHMEKKEAALAEKMEKLEKAELETFQKMEKMKKVDENLSNQNSSSSIHTTTHDSVVLMETNKAVGLLGDSQKLDLVLSRLKSLEELPVVIHELVQKQNRLERVVDNAETRMLELTRNLELWFKKPTGTEDTNESWV